IFGSLAFRFAVRRQVFQGYPSRACALDFQPAPLQASVSLSLTERTVRVANPSIKWVITALQHPRGPHFRIFGSNYSPKAPKYGTFRKPFYPGDDGECPSNSLAALSAN